VKINPVILSGGSGTRLWPLSREHYPKQLLALLGEQTLLQQTVSRLDGMKHVAAPLLVCNEEHRFLVAEQMRQLGKAPADIVLEPVGRNTAPALTLAALALLKHAPDDALMLVMPADHIIQDTDNFRAAVEQGAALAEKGRLVTFGIVPTAPETGYGYIKMGAGNNVAAFIEKPDIETASRYVAAGDHLWNSGMFMMQASVWLDELNRYHPAMLEACQAAYAQGQRDADFYRVNALAFGSCQSNSIDYAVMEETDKAAVVVLDAGWSDIGAWSSLWEASARDAQGNVVQGDVYLHATKNTLLISQHRFLAAVGLDDIIVVETPDAVLVAHKQHAQSVKEIVNRLKAEKRSEYKTHRRVYRPWGSYEGIDAGQRFQVKRLMVNPGASLSLQMHHHRAEHWVVVKGTARVTKGDEVFMLTENQSTYIPLGTTHRLENPGNIPLEIIEVQSGSYLGEDDIVRFEDQYNRHRS
jgi:mannose-1-phosphate guanylyltransferase/mannose-6-phosphate isomerase